MWRIIASTIARFDKIGEKKYYVLFTKKKKQFILIKHL